MNSLFINYFQAPVRATPINLVMARVLVGCYGLFQVGFSKDYASLIGLEKIGWGNWTRLPNGTFFSDPVVVPLLQLSLVFVLVMFMLGCLVRATSFASAFLSSLIILVGACHPQANPNWGMLSILLLLYGFFHGNEHFAVRREPDSGTQGVNHSFLRIALILVGLAYAFDAYGKLLFTGWDWVLDPVNLRLYIHMNMIRREATPVLAPLLIRYDSLVLVSTIGTIFFEAGLLIAILSKRIPLAFFFVGLAVMHVLIALTMNIFYAYYMIPLYLLFVPWDDLFGRVAERAKAFSERWSLKNQKVCGPTVTVQPTLRVVHEEAPTSPCLCRTPVQRPRRSAA